MYVLLYLIISIKHRARIKVDLSDLMVLSGRVIAQHIQVILGIAS